jgi:neutral ceramidase
MKRWLGALGGICSIVSIEGGELQAGAGWVDITPEVGTPMAGYYSERGAEGVHDPLKAKAVVLGAGETKAALVVLDLISTLRSTTEAARALIEAECGIPGSNVMISATHSHTGPVFSGNRRFDALGGNHPLAQKYTMALPALIARAVKEANGRLGSVTVSHGTGLEEGLAFNRRFHMQNGEVGWNPGKLNADIVQPAGPVDPQVQVVAFQGTRDLVALYVNFAMHLDTVGGRAFSADYPFTLAECLGRVYGPEMLTVFAIGCAGDINHINVNSARRQGGPGEAARIGTLLAANVLRSMEQMRTNAGALSVRTSSEIVRLPLREFTQKELEAARAVAEMVQAGQEPAPKFMDQVQAFRVLDVEAQEGRAHEVEVQVIALGKEIAWVSLPGEVFVELGLSIKAGSPFRQTIIAELANGSIGYIPTRRAYSEGNYEVISARCGEGSGEQLVESAVRQLRALFRPNGRP